MYLVSVGAEILCNPAHLFPIFIQQFLVGSFKLAVVRDYTPWKLKTETTESISLWRVVLKTDQEF